MPDSIERWHTEIRMSEEETIPCGELPEAPYYTYISGVVEETGKRYFQHGKLDRNCNYWSAPMEIAKRRRVMLIELKSKMNPRQICEFLKEHKHYFGELREKENPFKEE